MAGELELALATLKSLSEAVAAVEKRLELNEAKVRMLQPILDAHLATMPDAPPPISFFTPNVPPPEAGKG